MKYICLSFLLICISCIKNENCDYLKKVEFTNEDKEVLFSGKIDKDGSPEGLWILNDASGDVILELNFDSSTNAKDIFIKHYCNKKIIYDAYSSNGNIIEEKTCIDFQEISYNNGRYIFINYLEPYYYKEFGKIDKNNNSLRDIRDKINMLKLKYKKIPNFNNNELEALLCYFNPRGKDIRSGN